MILRLQSEREDYSAAMAKASRLSWIIWRISQTHLAHWAWHWLRAKISRGRRGAGLDGEGDITLAKAVAVADVQGGEPRSST